MHEYEPIALVVAGLLSAALLYLIYRSWSRKERERHVDAFESRFDVTYAEHEKAYKTARKKLSRDWDVIEIIHDVSDFSLGPAGLPEEISFEQAFDIAQQVKAARDHPIAIILHTMGGYTWPTNMIASAIAQHKGRKVAFVPYAAMSGGTLIALATNEIVMHPAAVLGPIDVQYYGYPASAYEYLKKTKDINRIDDLELMRSHVVEKFEEGALKRAKELLNKEHDATVVQKLMRGERAHGDTISTQEAKDLGIRATTKDFPKEVFALVNSKLGMVARDRAQVFRKGLDLQHEQSAMRVRRPATR